MPSRRGAVGGAPARYDAVKARLLNLPWSVASGEAADVDAAAPLPPPLLPPLAAVLAVLPVARIPPLLRVSASVTHAEVLARQAEYKHFKLSLDSAAAKMSEMIALLQPTRKRGATATGAAAPTQKRR